MTDTSDDRSRDRGRPRRQACALTLVTMVLAGLAAACGTSTPAVSARAAGPATYQQVLAYVQCVREHGYPTYGNPVQGPAGIVTPPNGPYGPPPPALQAAQGACRKLRPSHGGGLSDPAVRAKAVAQAEKLSQCMRAHGIANFPDPVSSPHSITIDPPLGAETTSPQYLAAEQACRRILPGPGSGGGPS